MSSGKVSIVWPVNDDPALQISSTGSLYLRSYTINRAIAYDTVRVNNLKHIVRAKSFSLRRAIYACTQYYVVARKFSRRIIWIITRKSSSLIRRWWISTRHSSLILCTLIIGRWVHPSFTIFGLPFIRTKSVVIHLTSSGQSSMRSIDSMPSTTTDGRRDRLLIDSFACYIINI